jgi:hypothetical protein
MEPAFSTWPTGMTDHHHANLDPLKERPKKPRHRHSASQLAALNELYERNEHPSLEDRTSLAEKLGMYAFILHTVSTIISLSLSADLGKQRQLMLGSKTNVLRPRSALALNNLSQLTISLPSLPYSALLIPPPLHSSTTLQCLNSILPLSLVQIPLNPPPMLPSNSLPFMLAIQNMITRLRVLYPCYRHVRGCESDHPCLKQKNYERLI